MTKVVDIFAGPGGLGEGFNQAGFDVILSAEMDNVACETLKLRKFFYQFKNHKVSPNYYKFIKGEIELEALKSQHKAEWNYAENAVANVELGTASGNKLFYRKLDQRLLAGEDFVLIGGPPCQAYSIAGRSRMLGLGSTINKQSGLTRKELQANLASEFYSDRRHTLYKEYLKILCRYEPSVFVMENVRGMGSARSGPTAKPGSIFSNIIFGLKNPYQAVKVKTRANNIPKGYKLYSIIETESDLFAEEEIHKPEDCLVRSEKFGIPQSRHRIIIVGVRADLEFVPGKLLPAMEPTTVRDAIGTIPKIRSGLSKESDTADEWQNALVEGIKENLIGFTDFEDELKVVLSNIEKGNFELTRGAKFFKDDNKKFYCSKKELRDVINDPQLQGIIQHESRSHIRSDLLRYFFVSLYGELTGKSPNLDQWTGRLDALKPKHANIILKKMALSAQSHKDRFKVQLWHLPSSTIVSHISKDGHYFIHPDPTQCRSLTVREAARLQTFPDNYYFCGTRTQQYHQVGNAVPVLLARKIADSIFSAIKKHTGS